MFEAGYQDCRAIDASCPENRAQNSAGGQQFRHVPHKTTSQGAASEEQIRIETPLERNHERDGARGDNPNQPVLLREPSAQTRHKERSDSEHYPCFTEFDYRAGNPEASWPPG